MKISVIIPCYNAGAYLAQTIGSAIDQSHPPQEIIVVDDGSTDESLTLARRFETGSGGTVRVLSQRSGRASRTRNIGAALATGDALMFLDADDVLAPDTLEALAAALSTRPGSVAACPWRRLDYVGERWVSRPASCARRRPDQDALSAWLTGWYYPPCSVLWSKEAYAHTGGWDEKATVNDDGDLMMRALLSGVPLLETAAGTSFYRRLPEGQTSLSGKRFEYAGVANRLFVIEKIATLLNEAERLNSYRASVRKAFLLIAADAAGRYPDLYEQAISHARYYGPSYWGRIGAWARRRHVDRAPGRAGGANKKGSAPPGHDSGKTATAAPADVGREVRFGLDRAEEVLRSAPAAVGHGAASHSAYASRPAVSVIIPTCNRAHLLPRALQSVLAQTFTDFEVLVIDDGLKDDTAPVVASYNDPRLRYLPQPENRGVSAARNRGLREARGPFIAFLDDDDEWLPEKLARQVTLFRRSPPDVGLIYTGVENVLSDGRRRIQAATARGDLSRTLLVKNVLHGAASNGMMRRQIITEIGFFDEHISAIEDYDYWLRLSRRYKIDCISEPLSRYYDVRVPTHDPTDQVRRSRNIAANLAARAQLYRKHGARMRDAGVAHLFLLESARRHLVPSCDDLRGARRLATQAVLQAPTSRTAHQMLMRLLVRSALRTVSRRGRSTWPALYSK